MEKPLEQGQADRRQTAAAAQAYLGDPQLAGRKRDLALFNLAIDSKLRGCDLVSLRRSDIAPRGLP